MFHYVLEVCCVLLLAEKSISSWFAACSILVYFTDEKEDKSDESLQDSRAAALKRLEEMNPNRSGPSSSHRRRSGSHSRRSRSHRSRSRSRRSRSRSRRSRSRSRSRRHRRRSGSRSRHRRHRRRSGLFI